MAKPKLPVQAIFDTVVEHCRKVTGFNPTDAQLAVIRKAFDGVFNVAQTATRKAPLSWAGAYRLNGSIDEAAALQSLQSAFCRLLHYHTGKSSAYLGTIINATENLGFCADWFGLLPHPTNGKKWYDCPEGSDERAALQAISDENRAYARIFADHCDTFCQVLVYLQSKGQTSSVAGDAWRQALGVA
jgi:hypothetical protein